MYLHVPGNARKKRFGYHPTLDPPTKLHNLPLVISSTVLYQFKTDKTDNCQVWIPAPLSLGQNWRQTDLWANKLTRKHFWRHIDHQLTFLSVFDWTNFKRTLSGYQLYIGSMPTLRVRFSSTAFVFCSEKRNEIGFSLVNVGDKMCWWQVKDASDRQRWKLYNSDRYKMLVTKWFYSRLFF